ncbi:MAG: lytic transglycosylase [endosymbiont of Galathealinum brachiosum]|uniref:Lytic transglycosylase n=1 Tax=endosymbiont of Galathealinum brachiosum TaxID=2200906 RepID=A0A370DMK2_9GAMM|nr:MAG: lytic transglycosylase [endosymbiont of Galathealinum brachiosum]
MNLKNHHAKSYNLHKLITTIIFSILLSGCLTTESTRPDKPELTAEQSAENARINQLMAQSFAAAEQELEDEFFAINPDDYAEESITDIWPRVRNGFNIADTTNNPRLIAELKWYARHQKYLDRVVERAEPFLHYVLNEAEKRNLPTELVLLPIVESAYQTFAYSHGRASGIWQFIPSTGKIYGLKQNWWYDGRRDVYASTQAALKYLEDLNREFKGNWLHALAAYNSGSGTVRRAIRKNKKRGKPTDFWNLKLPKETQAYVPKLLALKRLINKPSDYGITLNCIDDTPYFEAVDITAQLDLAMAADMAEIDLNRLYQLNPAFNHWATAPYGPHRLLIPVDNAETFKSNLAQIPKAERIKWKRHKIKEGQTLSHIADRYSVSVSSLKRLNNLGSKSRIRAGKHLVIPVSSRKLSDYNLTSYQRKKTLQNIRRKGNKITHIVQRGDTFWDLSRTYKVKSHSIARWNGMAIRDPLREGQKLVIWTKAPVSKTASHGRNTIQRISYRVRNGDSLYLIAQKFNVGIKDLKRWNSFTSKYLQPGQKIKLYVDVTRQTGNS